MLSFFFFFNDTATTEIYTLSLHDALPIYPVGQQSNRRGGARRRPGRDDFRDRKSTRLNSSHANISYAVFCLKKKKKDIARHVECKERAVERTRGQLQCNGLHHAQV